MIDIKSFTLLRVDHSTLYMFLFVQNVAQYHQLHFKNLTFILTMEIQINIRKRFYLLFTFTMSKARNKICLHTPLSPPPSPH